MRTTTVTTGNSKLRWVWAAGALLALPALASGAVRVSGGPGVVVVDREGGDGPYLGVDVVEEIDHSEGGARVTAVAEDSPADEAGLRAGDVIVRFDGQTIRGPGALTRRIGEHEPGDSVSLTAIREGRERSFEVKLGERPTPWVVHLGDIPDLDDLEFDVVVPDVDWEALGELPGLVPDVTFAPLAPCEGDDCAGAIWSVMGARPKLGVQLVETTPELRRHLGGTEESGVLVSKVLSGTAAERSGIRVGDLILSVGGDPVRTATDIRKALAGKDGQTVNVRVAREGKSLSIDVPLPKRETDVPTGPRASARPAPPPRPAALAASAPRPAPVAPPAPAAAPAPPAVAPPPPPIAVPPAPRAFASV